MTKDELLNCLAENVARERILTNIILEKKLLEQKEEHVYKQLLESAFDFMPENHLSLITYIKVKLKLSKNVWNYLNRNPRKIRQ